MAGRHGQQRQSISRFPSARGHALHLPDGTPRSSIVLEPIGVPSRIMNVGQSSNAWMVEGSSISGCRVKVVRPSTRLHAQRNSKNTVQEVSGGGGAQLARDWVYNPITGKIQLVGWPPRRTL